LWKWIPLLVFVGTQVVEKNLIITKNYNDTSNLAHKMLFKIDGLGQSMEE